MKQTDSTESADIQQRLAEMRAQAVGQSEIALHWAGHHRHDLAIVFINMAKLMLLEGEGPGTESEFWVLTNRSAVAEFARQPGLFLELAGRAHELGEKLFVSDSFKLAVARGNLGKALAAVDRPEEARKRLSEGIFGVASHNLPVDTSEKLKKYYREAFMDYARALQNLPPRPR